MTIALAMVLLLPMEGNPGPLQATGRFLGKLGDWTVKDHQQVGCGCEDKLEFLVRVIAPPGTDKVVIGTSAWAGVPYAQIGKSITVSKDLAVYWDETVRITLGGVPHACPAQQWEGTVTCEWYIGGLLLEEQSITHDFEDHP